MRLWLSATFAIALLHGTVASASARPGDPIPSLSLVDTQGKVSSLEPSTCRIYANGDRAGDALLADAMKDAGQALLDQQHAVVLADISDAPGFVRSLIRSSLRKRTYRTHLDQTGATRSVIPYRPEQITIIDLADGRITGIRFADGVEALRAALVEPHTHGAANAGPPP